MVKSLFVQGVQTGTVSHPTQRSFTAAKWNEAFAAIENPTTADVRLHETGIWAYHKLESIRRRLNKTWVDLPSERDHLLAFIGVSNRECHLLSTLGLSLQSESLVMEQIIQAKVDQPNGFGSASPDELLLSSVDSLRFPLQRIFTTKNPRVAPPELRDSEIIRRIIMAANLGQIYSIIEGYWMHALWNGWYVDSKSRSDSDLMTPVEWMRPIVTSMSEYRRGALSLEFLHHFVRAWNYDFTENQKSLMAAKVPKIILGDRSQRRFRVSARTQDETAVVMILEKRLQAERGFYLPLVDEPLNKLGTVTLHMLLQAWEVLYALAEQLMQTLPSVEDSGVYSIEKLVKYAPTVRKQELIELVSTWCSFEDGLAELIIDFFSYGKGDRWELWGHPLIKINDEELAPLLAPIRYSNIERTFELWMKDSGLNLSDKGPSFEKYIRNELIDSLSRSKLLTNAEVYASALVLRIDDEHEEIDIVIRIQNTVLVCEAKCLLFPAEPIEVSRYFEILEDARSQILRKADFVRRNLPKFASQLDLANVKDLTIEPVILVNQPFGAGSPQGAVPVADEWILKRFFEGSWDRLARYNEATELEAHSTFILYRSEDEASTTVAQYLTDPPQLRHYRQYMKPSLNWYPAVDENDRPLATVHLDVILPLPDLKLGIGKEH